MKKNKRNRWKHPNNYNYLKLFNNHLNLNIKKKDLKIHMKNIKWKIIDINVNIVAEDFLEIE